ncbi:MAG TPA: thioesterase domain-containing protein, partial [Myxococcota bacterium]|nr:thioesterase domain-containing protein [Myxococcota bacterium]
FCLPPIHGSVHGYQGVAAGLHLPVWGLRAPGLEPGEEPHTDLRRMAEAFLGLIRQVVPTGPLRLLGYSFGAAVAQLIATLEEVEMLLLVDGAAPRPAAVTEEAVLHLLGEAFGHPSVRSREELVDLLRAQQLFPEKELLSQMGRLERVVQAHLRAWTGHVPQPVDAKTWLLRSAEGPPGGPPELDLGWNMYVRSLEVVEVGGDHRGALRAAVEPLRRILGER